MVKKNPRLRHRFSFTEDNEKGKDRVTRDDIVNSLTRRSQSLGNTEVRESASAESAQSSESYESRGSSRHGGSKRWIATLTLLGLPVALWLSGLLPVWAINTGDSGIDYVFSKAANLGPLLLAEAATIGVVILVLGHRMRHQSS